GRRRAPRSGGGGRGDRPGDQRGLEVAAEHERGAIARGAGGEVSGDRAEGVGGPEPSWPTLSRTSPAMTTFGRRSAMLQTWRWFGPEDPVSLENVAQAGAAGVVTALHHRNQGEAWSDDDILQHRGEIERAGLVWSVVESIGVGEEIKTRSGAFRQRIENYKLSIRNAARGNQDLLLQLHGDHRLEPHRPELAAQERRDGAPVRRRRFRRLRSLHPRARRGRGRLFAGADRRGKTSLRGDDAAGEGNARAQPDRLAARARFRLRLRELQNHARALRRTRRRGHARQPYRLRARD